MIVDKKNATDQSGDAEISNHSTVLLVRHRLRGRHTDTIPQSRAIRVVYDKGVRCGGVVPINFIYVEGATRWVSAPGFIACGKSRVYANRI